jgi:ZIP family zinc transporter
MESYDVIFAFGLTLFAGLATGIGGALAYFARRTNTKFLTISLGFSAGVMIYVSFVEIFIKAKTSLAAEIGDVKAVWLTVAAFFSGMFIIGIIDRFVPSFENPHELRNIEDMQDQPSPSSDSALYRMGIFTALAIAIHNFPEGLATFVAALSDPSLGISIAIAIAIHNIPEGIAVSVPVFYATGNKKKAFFYSFLSGLAEPVGAIIGYFLFIRYFSDFIFGITFAMVAGIMVFISLDELLPAAHKYGEHHLAIYGLIAGMMVMALSLLLFL